MNPAEIQTTVADAIAKREGIACKHHHICIWQNKIVCRPLWKYPYPEFVFGIYSRDQLNAGFSTTEWNRIVTRIQTYLTQKGI